MNKDNNRDSRPPASSGAPERETPAPGEPESKPIAHEPLSTGNLPPGEEGAGESMASGTTHRRGVAAPHKVAAMKKRKENGRNRSGGYQGL